MAGKNVTERVDNGYLTCDDWKIGRAERGRTVVRWTLLFCSLAVLALALSQGQLLERFQAVMGENPLQAENSQLRAELESHRQRLEVEQATRVALEAQLNTLNERNAQLSEELNFIRNARSSR